jgi:hypothetical protein
VKTPAGVLGAIFIGQRDACGIRPTSREDQSMRLTKTLGMAGALILSALVGGTLIGSAFAQDEGTDGEDTAYCDTFMDAFAAELGSTRDDVVAAGKVAASAALDAAVAAGDLTEERATEIRERIEAYDGSGCAFGGAFSAAFRMGFGHGLGRGEVRGFLGGDVFEAAAAALGIESADLIGRLDDAGSLEALAGQLAVAYEEVKASILAAVQADLDAAVAEGLDQARADEVIERLTTWLDAGGELGELGPRGGHFRPGRGGFGPLPWLDNDDEDAENTGA